VPHLWQGVQLAIDLAVVARLHLKLGTPEHRGHALALLAETGYLDEPLAHRLVGATGFRNLVAPACERLDMGQVYRAASGGPAALPAFLAAIAKRVGGQRRNVRGDVWPGPPCRLAPPVVRSPVARPPVGSPGAPEASKLSAAG